MASSSRIKGPGPSSPTPSIKHSARRSQREDFWSTVLDTNRNSTISPTSRSVVKKSTSKVFYATPLPLSPEAAAALGISPDHLRLPQAMPHHSSTSSSSPALQQQGSTSSHHHLSLHGHHPLSSPSAATMTTTASTTTTATNASPMLSSSSSRKTSRADRKPGAFVCETCNSSYSQKGDMVRHMRSVHQGIRPYRCPHCGNAFGRRSILNKHIKTHMKEWLSLFSRSKKQNRLCLSSPFEPFHYPSLSHHSASSFIF